MADTTNLPVDLSRTVDVCVCTYRRPSIVAALASLGKQQLPEGWQMRVIVADNDETPSARLTVESAFVEHGIDGAYIHAPARNISVARNACLDAATANYAAYMDDDEIAQPTWLTNLINRLKATGAGVVFGRVAAVYDADAPKWAVNGDMHSTEAFFRNGVIEGGYTCNVLFRREAIGDLRFDPAFGRTGGEDTVFFGALTRNGVYTAYAFNAVVEEPVAADRANLDWLFRRAFRSGQSHSMVIRANGRNRAVVLVKSVLKIGFCCAAAVATMWSAVMWRKALVRGALHMGVLSGILGRSPLQLY
jgi:succinoglycan biosynthesis protein ExoM